MTQAEAQRPRRAPWWRSRPILLCGIAILALVVLARLGLMTFWSISEGGAAISDARLVLFWVLALAVLAMLSRFAWQISSGKHH